MHWKTVVYMKIIMIPGRWLFSFFLSFFENEPCKIVLWCSLFSCYMCHTQHLKMIVSQSLQEKYQRKYQTIILLCNTVFLCLSFSIFQFAIMSIRFCILGCWTNTFMNNIMLITYKYQRDWLLSTATLAINRIATLIFRKRISKSTWLNPGTWKGAT